MRTVELGASLLQAFAQIPDPRAARGRRHPLAAILTLAVAAMLGEIVHTQPTQIRYAHADTGRWRATDQSHEALAARPTNAQLQPLRQSPSRLATQGHTHRFEPMLQRRCASLVARRQIGQPLTKGLARTRRIQAAKPPRMQAHTDWCLAQGQISQHSLEAAIRPMRTALAVRVTRSASGGGEIDDDVLASDGQRVQAEPGPRRRDGGKQCGKTQR